MNSPMLKITIFFFMVLVFVGFNFWLLVYNQRKTNVLYFTEDSKLIFYEPELPVYFITSLTIKSFKNSTSYFPTVGTR